MANTKYSTIGRKVLMALSGLFLMIFLVIHVTVNALSVINPEAFNVASHFMGYNPFIQFMLQPVLIAGVIVHFVLGFILELKNRNARSIKYHYNKPSANSSWVSRNMIYSGLVILLFLFAHLAMMWVPELDYKFISGEAENPTRYYHELNEKFQDPLVVVLYVLAFIFLALHLLHGFQSAFQSVGFNNNKFTPMLKKLGKVFAIGLPAIFALIAIYHFLNPATH